MAEARTGSTSRHRTRAGIVEVAARLLRERGVQAVTIRAVAQSAGMQAPTIYRFFEDKDALLDAVAEHVYTAHLDAKAVSEELDPLEDLRAGWNAHIGFGLENAALIGLITDPARGVRPSAEAAGLEVLRARVRRIAAIGRLRVTERRAVELIQAAGIGAVLTLLAMPAEERELELADAMYESVMRQILTDAPEPRSDHVNVAAALRAAASKLPSLTDAERALLSEWLDRPGNGPA
ncbi:TetR/AcrR family transcriptional regulator [Glycomyces tarimensis]